MHLKTSHQPEVELGFGDWVCNWGLHLCGLYQSDQEWTDILFPYLHQGARDGDLQAYVPVEQNAKQFHATYARLYPDHAHETRDTHLFQLPSARDLFFPDEVFSSVAMDTNRQRFFETSQKDGARNVRATAEMSWALEQIPGVEHLMAYESRLNYFIPGKPWISICLYDVRRFSGEMIMGVLQTHPWLIHSGVIMQNPLYREPDVWLREYAPGFLPGNGACSG